MRDRAMLLSDMAVVDRSRSAVSGSIVLGLVGGEFTIRTYRLRAGGAVVLGAASRDLSPIVITEDLAFEVWGVASGVRRVSDAMVIGDKPPAPEVSVHAHAAWPAALSRPAPPARVPLASRPTMHRLPHRTSL